MNRAIELVVGINAIAGISVAVVTLVGVSATKKFLRRLAGRSENGQRQYR